MISIESPFHYFNNSHDRKVGFANEVTSRGVSCPVSITAYPATQHVTVHCTDKASAEVAEAVLLEAFGDINTEHLNHEIKPDEISEGFYFVKAWVEKPDFEAYLNGHEHREIESRTGNPELADDHPDKWKQTYNMVSISYVKGNQRRTYNFHRCVVHGRTHFDKDYGFKALRWNDDTDVHGYLLAKDMDHTNYTTRSGMDYQYSLDASQRLAGYANATALLQAVQRVYRDAIRSQWYIVEIH